MTRERHAAATVLPSQTVSSYRYQLRALASIVRYVPIFAGVLLTTMFTTSVLSDDGTIILQAWKTGAELLGMYGGFGVVALPFLFLATARLKRGRKQQLSSAAIEGESLVLHTRESKTINIALDRIRGGFSHPTANGKVRVSLELEGGLTDGDRVALDLEPEVAESLAHRLIGRAPTFDLTRTRYGFGVGVTFASVALGVFLAQQLLTEVLSAVSYAIASIPSAAVPATPPTLQQIDGWKLGLMVACSGLVHAVASFLLASRRVKAGLDGLRIEGVFGATFIPYTSIASIHTTLGRLLIEWGDGRTTVLLAPGTDPALLEEIVRLVEERCDASSPVASSLPGWSTLSRRPATQAARARLRSSDWQGEQRERPSLTELGAEPAVNHAADEQLESWREAVLGKLDATSYRTGSLSAGELTLALRDPGVSRDKRLAMAVALVARGEREHKQQVRLAAAEMADDATRAVLERLAEDEADDALLVAFLRQTERTPG